jgi:hypothetical protein
MGQLVLLQHGIAEHVTIKWHENLSTPSMTMVGPPVHVDSP